MRVAMLVLNPMTHDARVEREARALGEAGHEVTVVARRIEPLPEEEDRGPYRVVRVPLRPLPRRHPVLPFLRFAQFTVRSARRAAGARPDVVHAHDANTLLAGWLAARRAGARLVYDAHELESDRMFAARRLHGVYRHLRVLPERALVRSADAVITVTDGIADILARRYAIRRPVVLRNCADGPEPTGSRRLREELGIPDDAPVALYVGGLQPARGIETFLAAVRSLPDVFGVVLGDGPLLATLRATACARTRVPGQVPMDELPEYVEGADVGVALIEDSCRSYRLSLPNKLFQYVQAGLPVVVSDLPEMASIVRRTGIGLAVDPRSPTSVADAIARLARPGPDRDAARTAVARAAPALHWRKERERLLSLYELLGR